MKLAVTPKYINSLSMCEIFPHEWLIKSFFFVMAAFIFLPKQNIKAQITEYEIKAIFLEKFTEFVEYPGWENTPDEKGMFVIGVYGESPLYNELTEYFQDKKLKGRKTVVKQISNMNLILNCNLLFITQSEKKRINQILDNTMNKPILTVGDTEGYCEKGVLINFFLEDNKIRFEINFNAVQKSGLYMNYRLLKLAKVITPFEEGS